ncbi:MAG TPA: head GIN domain-containing protein [Pyrinomonadaceae bacterium]
MKTIVLTLLLISLAAGCSHGILNQVHGSGNRQREQRQVAAFTAISTDGAFDITVTSQKDLALEIEGDDNILPLVGTDVSGNVLHIKNRKGYSVSQPIKITISVPNLEAVTSNGAGRIRVSGLKNERFELDINGAPTLETSGETEMLKIKANGAGNIDTRRLRATKADVNSNGVSTIELHAREQLDIVVSGPSNVTYEGDPTVNKTINGPGTVQKKVSQGS